MKVYPHIRLHIRCILYIPNNTIYIYIPNNTNTMYVFNHV